MLLVKLSAQDHRIIDKAKTDAEAQGVVQLVKERIQQTLLLKEFGKTPTLRQDKYRWKEALADVRAVLGEQATFPKITDANWYHQVNGAIMHHGMDTDYVTKLAQYAKENMRLPIKFSFLICQHERILSGEFNKKPAGASGGAVDIRESMGPELPED